ncbi:MAG: pseudouridine-5'-phosphate glycosidase [Phycisphaeraceae bacterium]|nr:MAG: pseudouridine-5'-phosphate glycosidase [Phycisphaeraceae bacterium]
MNAAGPDRRRAVALETTLIVHGVPREAGRALARELADIVRAEGAEPALVGVVRGEPVVGMSDDQLDAMLAEAHVEKANTANLGVLMHRRAFGATTVSATMQLAADAGVRFFATGGVGGVHHGLAERLDISADLGAFTRFPVAVVSSGVKSILDVVSTREALETLGVPVVGFRTDRFPAFYLRESEAGVDARFDDEADLAAFIRSELERTGRGVLIANPIPAADELADSDWRNWLAEADSRLHAEPTTGRDVTPRLLAHLHDISGGATLRANLALVKSNARLAAKLAAYFTEHK